MFRSDENSLRSHLADDLLQSIEKAFPTQPMPDTTLHQGQLLGATTREMSASEWQQAADIDAGMNWREIPARYLIECPAALSHLGEQEFVYYLPAFLCFAIRHADAPLLSHAWALNNSIVFTVTHCSAHGLARYRRLTDSQRQAVIGFLQILANSANRHREDARKALDRYWLHADQSGIHI